MASDGRFVVTWTSVNQDGDGGGVYAQRFTANAVKIGPEFRVNTEIGGYQVVTDIAIDPDGDFTIAWEDVGLIRLRQYTVDGVTEAEFTMDAVPGQYQYIPRTVADGAGGLSVVWQHNVGVDVQNEVKFRRFAANLSPSGLSLNATAVPENATAPIVVGTLIGADRDLNTGDVLTYSLVSG